jgi:hypothetical protein
MMAPCVSRNIVETQEIQREALKQITTEKFFSPVLLSLLTLPFTAKGWTDGRRGDSSVFTVTATCTRRHGFKRKS